MIHNILWCEWQFHRWTSCNFPTCPVTDKDIIVTLTYLSFIFPYMSQTCQGKDSFTPSVCKSETFPRCLRSILLATPHKMIRLFIWNLVLAAVAVAFVWYKRALVEKLPSCVKSTPKCKIELGSLQYYTVIFSYLLVTITCPILIYLKRNISL